MKTIITLILILYALFAIKLIKSIIETLPQQEKSQNLQPESEYDTEY